ncbi:pyruvate formate-lyase-activating protein, partial [Bacillus sp. D-CC]
QVLPIYIHQAYDMVALGHKYPLANVEPPTEKNVEQARHILQAV